VLTIQLQSLHTFMQLHPWSPHHFTWQPSTRVSQTLRAVLPQSRDCSCYVSRPIPAPPPLWLQKHTNLRAHDFAHSPHLCRQLRLFSFTCAWRWGLCRTNPAIYIYIYIYISVEPLITDTAGKFQFCPLVGGSSSD
jgi:hypothetical protein